MNPDGGLGPNAAREYLRRGVTDRVHRRNNDAPDFTTVYTPISDSGAVLARRR